MRETQHIYIYVYIYALIGIFLKLTGFSQFAGALGMYYLRVSGLHRIMNIQKNHAMSYFPLRYCFQGNSVIDPQGDLWEILIFTEKKKCNTYLEISPKQICLHSLTRKSHGNTSQLKKHNPHAVMGLRGSVVCRALDPKANTHTTPPPPQKKGR